MIKFKLYFDKDEETKWLNQLASEGWAMTGFFAGFYTFEKCEKGQWIYQIDFGEKFGRATENYREFMAEAGIEIVQCWGYWIILRKRASEGSFQLYTDVESSIEHYTNILKLFKVVTILNITGLFMEIIAALNGFSFGWALACLIGALVVVLVNATLKTKNTINELKSRQTGIEAVKDNRNISPFLSIGLLFNSLAVIINISVKISIPIQLSLQIIAIVLMLIGIYKTAEIQKNNRNK